MDDKTLHIQTDFIQQDGKDTFYNHRYEPTPYDVLDNLFSVFAPEPDSCLVDYGCGPGRLNFYVEKRFGLSSIGVEYAREFYEKALDIFIFLILFPWKYSARSSAGSWIPGKKIPAR